MLWVGGGAVTVLDGNDATFSLADALMFGINPMILLALVFYGRSAVPRPIPASRWVDALLSSLTVAAVGATFVIQSAIDSVQDAKVAVAIYPTGASVLASAAVGLLALRGWTFDRRFALAAAGTATLALTEILYRHQQALHFIAGFGTLYDVGWTVAGTCFAAAAWQTQRPLSPGTRRTEIVVPILLGAVALSVLVYDGARGDASKLTITIAGLAVAMLIARMALSLTMNYRLLAHTRLEAVTDSVTGLGNARRLVADLERVGAAPSTLVLLDLNGFKSYNDTFGHIAGDHLLARIGAALADGAGPTARAYRMGGDEFCVLLPADATITPSALAAHAAQRGDGFNVTAAYGVVALPAEARGANAALRLADERMYAHKRGDGGRAQPVVDALAALLKAHEPSLYRHAAAVADLAEATARALRLSEPACREAVNAALLHDLGTMALPAAMASGKLGAGHDDEERALVEHHTVFGARVIATTPELRGVAALVRSRHERWDGSGYPDGLAADAIPLGSRVVFACHAFDRLTSPNTDQAPARTRGEAIAVLRQWAGSSFDAAVVDALAATVVRAPVAASATAVGA
ncbi:MAG TPA: HD domain-containing phosphohydrolase [Conexibacter sp.]